MDLVYEMPFGGQGESGCQYYHNLDNLDRISMLMSRPHQTAATRGKTLSTYSPTAAALSMFRKSTCIGLCESWLLIGLVSRFEKNLEMRYPPYTEEAYKAIAAGLYMPIPEN